MESAENQAQPISDQKSESDNSQSLSKTETIALLNDSIDRLEETIKRISEDSAKIPSSNSINNLINTTQELEDTVSEPEAEVSSPMPATQESAPQVPQSTPKTTVSSQTSPAQTAAPKSPQKKNLGLIVIVVTAIAIAIVTIFWLWKPQAITSLLPQTKPIPTEIVTDLDSSPEQTAETQVSNSPDLLSDSDGVADFPKSIQPEAEPIEDVVETIIPPELISPGRPKNLKMVTIKPELDFSPEQNLVAALETKLKELVQAYPSEVIQNIQISLTESSLLVQVTDGWYELEPERQNSLGNDILERSRAFGFDKLELKDNSGILVARNPIIGEKVIILQDTKKQLESKQS